MTAKDPADAVREALLPCPFCDQTPQFGAWRGGLAAGHTDATAIECASGLDDCPVNPSVTGFTRQEAVAKWNRRPSLAALAGAAPDGDFVMVPRVALLDFKAWFSTETAVGQSLRNRIDNMIAAPHAPAKAREDGALRALPGKWRGITTNRDIEWSARKFMEGYDAALVNCANDLDAALATLAEGE